MDYTENYNLGLSGEHEFYNVEKENENCKKIDAELKKLNDTTMKKGDSVEVKIATAEEATACEADDVFMTPKKTLLAIEEWGGSGTGGGGNSGATIPVMSSSFSGGSFSLNEEIEIRYKWSSPNTGNGVLHVLVDSIEFTTNEVAQGVNRYSLTGLSKGSHSIQMYVIDRGGEYTDTLKFTIKVGTLDITSVFDDSNDFATTQIIKIPITVDTISLEPIYMTRTIDNEEVTLLAQNGYNVFQLPALSSGAHKVSFKATSSVYVSNVLSYDIVIEDSDNLTLISDFDKSIAVYKDLLEIQYRISLKGESKFNVSYYVDGELVRSLVAPLGSNIWSTRDLEIGTRKLKIVAATLDGSKTAELTWTVLINPSDYTPLQPVTDASLLCYFDATSKSNQDTDKEIWKDKSGNDTVVNLYNVNYGSNGWIDGALKLNGGAYAEIDLQALKNNAPYGLTVDIKYKTRDVGNQDACVIDMRGSDSNNKGFAVDTQNMYLNSATTKITSTVEEEAISRATFVIDRDTGTARIYNNGVQCEAYLLGANEDFYNNTKIYLNTKLETINGVWQPSVFGDCDIYSIRVYDRSLSADEVVQNLIADIPELEEQEEKYNINYKNNMPTMYFYGDTSAMTKDTKVPLRIKYISPDATKYGDSFDLTDCPVSWQGTSSLQYAVKNYKMKLVNQGGSKYKYSPFKNGILESTYCLKADYMESSHANNTGMAKFINDNLYDELTPPQKLDANVRTTINGFPIQLYIAKDSVSTPKYVGIFNFNLDKSCNPSFGMDNSIEGFENNCCFEVSANSDTSAGGFQDDDMTSIKSDFEIVYPDEDDITSDELGAYYEKLKRVVSWVKNSDETTFKAELEQYFNKEYLIKYFLQAHMFGMVDNLGKNMFLRTWDGNVWYPTFYDLDSELGLDNTGYLKFQSDIDIVEGVYNTSSSKLFVMLQACFADDIKSAYKKLRMDKRYSMETVMSYWYDQQVGVIGESQYNKDMEAKYIAYKNDYLFMMHGRRYEHLKKWLKERFLYLDTIYGYEADTSASITIRANKAATISIDVLTYSPQYLTVKWKNGDGGIQKLKCGRDANGNMTPTRFTGTLTTATDQEVIIYNAKQIKRIDGLSNLNPSVLNFVEASRLTEIVCQKSTLLADVRLNSKNSLLGKVDFNGCRLLTGVLDLSLLENLTYVDLNDTKLTNVIFPTGGCSLKRIYIKISELKTVDIENMPMLEEVWVGIRYDNNSTGVTFSSFKILNCPKAVARGYGSQGGWNSNSPIFSIDSEDITIEKTPKLFDNAGCVGICTDSQTMLRKCVIKDIEYDKELRIKCANSLDTEAVLEEFEIDCYANRLQIFGLGFMESQDTLNINMSKINEFIIKKYTNIKNINFTSNLSGIMICGTWDEQYSCGQFYTLGNGISSGAGIKSFTNNTEFERVSIDGVVCTDTMDFSHFQKMNLLYFHKTSLPETITNMNINFDGSEVLAGDSPYKNGKSILGLPIRMNVTGYLKAGNHCKTWCSATATSYPPIENFDNLELDLHAVTDFNSMFEEWKNLKKLPSEMKYIFEQGWTYTSIFKGCTSLEDLGDINGSDLDMKLATNSTTYAFQNVKGPFSIGNLTARNLKFSVDASRAIFADSGITSIGNIELNDNGTYDVLSGCSNLISVGDVNIPNSTNVRAFFNGCSKLESVGIFTVLLTGDVRNLFSNCSSLTSIKFNAPISVIDGSNIHHAPLDLPSITSFINMLVDLEGSTKTATLNATTFALLTEDLINIASSKGWTLASA